MRLPSRLHMLRLGAVEYRNGQVKRDESKRQMIAQLSGKLISKTPTASVVDCMGVGYEVFHTPFTAEKLTGEAVVFLIQTIVREDAFQLFGFINAEERGLFRELLKVSGVGPKMAMGILSGIPYQELIAAISQKDLSRLQKIPGIGKKTAERLTVELSDRLSKLPVEIELLNRGGSLGRESELESVLTNLGYQRPEVQRAMKNVKTREKEFEGLSLEAMVKATLRELTQPKVQ